MSENGRQPDEREPATFLDLTGDEPVIAVGAPPVPSLPNVDEAPRSRWGEGRSATTSPRAIRRRRLTEEPLRD